MSDEVLFPDTVPGRAPGRYLVSTVREDGTAGPDVVIVVADGEPDRWEPVET
jgi:hypothetical protein